MSFGRVLSTSYRRCIQGQVRPLRSDQSYAGGGWGVLSWSQRRSRRRSTTFKFSKKFYQKVFLIKNPKLLAIITILVRFSDQSILSFWHLLSKGMHPWGHRKGRGRGAGGRTGVTHEQYRFLFTPSYVFMGTGPRPGGGVNCRPRWVLTGGGL